MEWNANSQLAGETWWETQCSVYEELGAARWRRRWPSHSRGILRRRQAPRQRCRAVGSPGVVPGVGAAMRGLHAAVRRSSVVAVLLYSSRQFSVLHSRSSWWQ